MFKTLFSLIAIFTFFGSSSQSLEAVYDVKKMIHVDPATGAKVRSTALTYSGNLLRKGNRYIYFSRPLFLDKYPDGNLSFKIDDGANTYSNIQVCADSVQSLAYKSIDSNLFRYAFDFPGKGEKKPIFVQSFESGFQNWVYHPDTKEINGLKCQKATLAGAESKPQWEVWFCADIPMDAGIENIFNLPGLVVEAENFVSKTTYTLLRYTTKVNIPDKLFWPKEFCGTFTTRRTIRKKPASS